MHGPGSSRISTRYNGSGMRGGARGGASSRHGAGSDRMTNRTGGYGGYGGGGGAASDARSLRSAQAGQMPESLGQHMPQSTRQNPMAGPLNDSADDYAATRSGDGSLFDDLPWLFQLQRYSVLSSNDAETVLLACLRDMSSVISDLFQLETEMVTTPGKALSFAVLNDAVTALIRILEKLPDSCFVDRAGNRDANFHNVVRGLCHLWGSLDIAQLSSVTRLLSLTRPAEAVAQAATQSRIRLPVQQRLVRDSILAIGPERHTPAVLVAVAIAVAGLALCVAAQFSVITQEAAYAGYALQIIAFSVIAGMTIVAGMNRTADAAMRNTICRSVTAGFTKVTTNANENGDSGGGGGGEVFSLAGIGSKAGVGVSGLRAGTIGGGSVAGGIAPSAAAGGGGDGDEWNRYYPPKHIAYRYPDGVLMMPAGSNDAWVCIDARPLNKHAMIIGLDGDRRVSVWNKSAADATGFATDRRLGHLVKECLTAPGDTLFRLPRMVGDHAVLQLHNVVASNTVLPFVVGDMRDLAGDPAGHCFVAPAIREDYTSMRSYLHEYLQHELWEGLAYGDAIAKQLKEIIVRAESDATTGQVAMLSNPSEVASMASSARRRSTMQELRATSGDASTPPHNNSGDAKDALHQAAADLRLLFTSLQREVSKMRLSVRLMGWEALSNTARLVGTHWEWTNGERVLGAAARYHFAKASVGVETNVPASFRLPASAARIIKAIINYAPGHCTVFLQHSQRSKRVGRITVTVTLVKDGNASQGVTVTSHSGNGGGGGGGSGAPSMDGSAPSRGSITRSNVTLEHLRRSHAATVGGDRFDFDVLSAQIGREVFECCATVQMFSDDTAVSVHFPCVRDVDDEDGGDGKGDGKNMGDSAKHKSAGQAPPPSYGLQPTAETYCDCIVAICLEQPMDQHNLGMMLLGIAGVSLTVCRDVHDLQMRLASVDMVIIANAFRAAIEVDYDTSAVVIPVVDEDAPYQADASFLRLPLSRDHVFRLVVEASEVVAENKRAAEEAREREVVLQARHDATWTKGALLGRGTFGVCYCATNDVTGGKMAVKQFEFVPKRAQALGDADAERERFMTSLVNEIRILTKLEHPNIVHYFHCERTDSGVNLFMELCEGSLHDVIKLHRTRNRDTLYYRALPVILQQTLLAVAYLHNLSIIHRDLKPQNILTKGDRVKLTDFGTAHQVRQDETVHDTQGTLRFMAPEVYRAESYNWSCDVWSIGCIVCELLDVRVRFMQPGQHHQLGDIHQSDIVVDSTVAPHITDDARDFISLCLQVRPDLRPAVATLLLHPFVDANRDTSVRLTRLMKGGAPTPAGLDDAYDEPAVPRAAAAEEARFGVAQREEEEMLPAAAAAAAVAPTADFEGDGFSLDSNA